MSSATLTNAASVSIAVVGKLFTPALQRLGDVVTKCRATSRQNQECGHAGWTERTRRSISDELTSLGYVRRRRKCRHC